MKTILISGANRGIGLETATQLLELGHRIIATSRNPAKSKSLSLLQKHSGLLSVIQLDVMELKSIESLYGHLKKERIIIDILINNAGVYSGGKYPAPSRDAVIYTNFFGVLNLTKKLLPLLGPKGRVINISSGVGSLSGFSKNVVNEFLSKDLNESILEKMVGDYLESGGRLTGWSPDYYAVSKASLNILTRIWQREWGPDKTIVSICPGWVRTDMGGTFAPRSIKKGVETIVWACFKEELEGGLFYRDKKAIAF